MRFCTVLIIELVILNLEYHGFLADTYIKTCYIAIGVFTFNRAVHTTLFTFKALCCGS